MIRIVKEFVIDNAALPLSWSYEMPEGVFIVENTITDNCIRTVFEVCDYQDYCGTLSIVDAENCTSELDFCLGSPCDDFTATLSEIEDCDGCGSEFQVVTTQSATVTWEYDPTYIQFVGSENAKTVRFIDKIAGESTIRVKAVNANGCEVYSNTITYTSCVPTTTKQFIDVACLAEIVTTSWFTPEVTLCDPEYTIDWNTFEIIDTTYENDVLNPGEVFSTQVLKKEDEIKINFLGDYPQGIVTFKYSAKDCRNVVFIGEICMEIEPCLGLDFTIPLKFNGLCVPGTMKKSLGKYTSVTDLTTLTFSGVGGTLVNNQVLETPYGTFSLDVNGDLIFEYNGSPIGLRSQIFNYTIGQGVVGQIELNADDNCPAIPDADDLQICLVKNGEVTLNIGELNDEVIDGVLISKFPDANVVTNLDSDNNITLDATNDFKGVTTLEYRLQKEGLFGAKGVITIAVGLEEVAYNNLSICSGTVSNFQLVPSIGKFEKLVYLGYGENLEQGDFPYTIGNGPLSTSGNVDYTNLPCGVYNFEYNPGGECRGTIDLQVEKVCADSLTDISTEVCEDVCDFDLNEKSGLSLEGDWTDLLGNSNLEGSRITPCELDPGTYSFRFNKDNQGLYNEVNCTSSLVFTVVVKAKNSPVVIPCTYTCSNGPDYTETDCDVVVPDPNQVPNCIYDFNSWIGIPSDMIVTLDEAPQNPVSLYIDGVYTPLNTGDTLPLNFSWGASVAPPGDYQFTAKYNDVCAQTLSIPVTILPGVNDTLDTDATICIGDSTLNLGDLIGDTGGVWTLISETLTSEGTPTYDLSTGSFTPNVSGIWVFDYMHVQTNGDPNCTNCQTNSTLTLTVNPVPGPGIPQPFTVCNAAACILDIYPDFFIVNLSQLGQFIYDGYSSTSQTGPTDAGGGWGGIQATPIEGQELPPQITFEGAAPGFYFFTNTVGEGDCVASSTTVVQVVAVGNAGTGATLEYCNDQDTCIDLDGQLTAADPGGNWTIPAGIPIATASCEPGLWVGGDQATLNPLGIPAGVYIIEYVQTTPAAVFPIQPECNTCSGGVATITLTITEAAEAGDAESSAVC